jgi:hypothetical protein
MFKVDFNAIGSEGTACLIRANWKKVNKIGLGKN